jgi:beta-glucosidase
MKKTIWGLALLLGLASCSGNKSGNEMDKFIDDLMGKMTLEEKLGQLNLPVTGDIVTGAAQSSNVAENIRAGRVGGLFNLKGAGNVAELQRIAVEESRLGIPLIFGMDVIHGYETVFPIPLGLSCTWDMAAIERSAQIAAQEATADGICWTFSPMVDICHDARWGRISEGNGEDPFLGSRIAEAMVRGYQQGDLTQANTMMACVKHFALYGAPEAGRDYNTVDMSLWRMYNEYFPPYKAACDAGAGSYMASFNIVNGVPATGNRWLLTDVLRNQWGFDGFVVSDYTGIAEMVNHGMGDLKEVSALALHAGLDMDMVSDGLVGTLAESLKEGRTTQADIDQACRRILEAKYKLGLFEDPYRYCDTTRYAKEVYTEENRREARRIAGESFVLLKNEGDILPLKRQGKIALIGPLANTRANMPGTWSVAATSERYSTVVEGLKRAVGDKAQVLYAKGCNLMYDAQAEADATMFGREMRDNRSDAAMRAEALAIARQANVIVFAGGEASEMAGECSSRVGIEMPDAQHDLLVELVKLGKPIVLLNFSGRPMILNWETEHIPAILEVWFGGSEAADAIADVVFGDVVPSGKLTTSFPRHIGQLPMSYSYYNTGRPVQADAFVKFQSCYMDVSNTPLYPFGYGLSYTTFSYSPVTLSSNELTNGGEIEAKVTVSNTGKCEGTEVVQLYIRDLVGSVTRPVKELKGFKRVTLKEGESCEVTFNIDADLLKFYNGELEYVCEPGEFEVMIGTNSADVQSAKFALK